MLLQQLGINDTVVFQFIIYIITFPLLFQFVFKPFSKAQEERQNRTKGSEQLSYEYQQKTTELQAEYQKRAREVNQSIHEIFSRAKADAADEQEKLISAAKLEAQKTIDENQKKIGVLMAAAGEELRGQTSSLSLMITQKLLGKT